MDLDEATPTEHSAPSREKVNTQTNIHTKLSSLTSFKFLLLQDNPLSHPNIRENRQFSPFNSF